MKVVPIRVIQALTAVVVVAITVSIGVVVFEELADVGDVPNDQIRCQPHQTSAVAEEIEKGVTVNVKMIQVGLVTVTLKLSPYCQSARKSP